MMLSLRSSANAVSDGCIDVQRTSLTMPISGYVIYGVTHQHTGGIGSTLYGEVIFNLQSRSQIRFFNKHRTINI
jgi:hypothetical protein